MPDELKLLPCIKCGAKLKKKITVRKELVYDHPRNGCENEWSRVRNYVEAINAWNAWQTRVGEGEKG